MEEKKTWINLYKTNLFHSHWVYLENLDFLHDFKFKNFILLKSLRIFKNNMEIKR